MWDSVGQERYQVITKNFFNKAHAILLLYDISNRESFNSVDNWAKQIRSILSNEIQVVLVGHKCDLVDERVVSLQEGSSKADELNMKFFEASAKDRININETFDYIIDYLIEHPLKLDKNNNVKIQLINLNSMNNNKNEEQKKKRCC